MDKVNLSFNSALQGGGSAYAPGRKALHEEQSSDGARLVDVASISSATGSGLPADALGLSLPVTPVAVKKEEDDKEVTFMFYMNGQFADLEQASASALLGLEQTGSDENVNIVAQLGRAAQRDAHPNGGFDRIDNDWSGVRRYYVNKSPIQTKDSVSIADLQNIRKIIPDNPLIHYTLGDVYSAAGEKAMANDSYDLAKSLGYEKFLNDPLHPMVEVWGDEFDRQLQPLRDREADNTIFASPVVQFKDKASMMHPQSLKDFVSWGMEKYPAKHYVLVLMGHGGAWTGSLKMNPSEIGMAVQAGVQEANHNSGRNDHIDALVFNSCYMGNLESVEEMRKSADITIASQMSARTAIFYNWPSFIQNLQDSLADGKEFDARKLAKDYVDLFRQEGDENAGQPEMIRRSRESYVTLTALDNKKLGRVTEAWGTFVEDWKKTGVPDEMVLGDIKNAKNFPSFAYSPEMMFDYGTLRDVGSIAYNVINNPKAPEKLKKDCQEIRAALKDTVIAEQHTGFKMEGATGLTVWAPTNAADIALMKDAYGERVPSFVQETGWNDKLESFLKNIDGRKLGEFLQAIQSLGQVRAMIDISEANPRERKQLENKAEIIEKEIDLLRKEMDLTNPATTASRRKKPAVSIEDYDGTEAVNRNAGVYKIAQENEDASAGALMGEVHRIEFEQQQDIAQSKLEGEKMDKAITEKIIEKSESASSMNFSRFGISAMQGKGVHPRLGETG